MTLRLREGLGLPRDPIDEGAIDVVDVRGCAGGLLKTIEHPDNRLEVRFSQDEMIFAEFQVLLY